MKEKWVKLHSKFLNWEWYKDKNTKILFIHCLLKANWKDGKFEGIEIPRGSFVTSRKKLAEELEISEQSIRTSLNKLKSTNEITIKSTNKFTIISIVNYEEYQKKQEVVTNEITNIAPNEQPTTNQQLTTIEEYKTIDNIISSSYIEEMRARVYQFYETNFAKLLSPIEKEELDGWIDYFQNEEVLKYGIRVAVLNRVTTMNYLNGIYQNWKDNGYRTLEQCKPKPKEEKEKIELFDYDWFEDEEPH